MTPYYADDLVTIYHGDAREVLSESSCVCVRNDACGGFLCRPGGQLLRRSAVLVTDPPYGRAYRSAKAGSLRRSIEGDDDTSVRDDVLGWWRERPALVFGQWQVEPPLGTKAVLIWDAYPLGMGDTSIPWKPCAHEIYVLGSGFTGHRDSCVLTGFAPVQSLARNGRTHPHEKPVELMQYLIDRCPPGAVVDPFCGTGATLVAAKRSGRSAVGIEIDEGYCERAANRSRQEVLGLSA
jgi:uncharacterized Fe-S cluster protein YjdI